MFVSIMFYQVAFLLIKIMSRLLYITYMNKSLSLHGVQLFFVLLKAIN